MFETYHGCVAGAISLGEFKRGESLSENALLFSITHRKVYRPKDLCKPNYKSLRADEKYLFYGNSELRVELKEMDVYCKIGSFSGFFEGEQEDIDCMIGPEDERMKEKTSFMKSYELYSVEFENEQ